MKLINSRNELKDIKLNQNKKREEEEKEKDARGEW